MSCNTSAKCTFCAQYVLHTRANVWSRFGEKYGQSSDIILETSNCLAVAGLGALTEGYVLIFPKDHYLSIGAIPHEQISEITRLKEVIGTMIEHLYGQVVFFEHGMSTRGYSGGCIDHAHIHSIPCRTNFRPYFQPDFPETQINDLHELSRFAEADTSYMFYENVSKDKFVYTSTEQIPSQYFRRLWAHCVGRPEEWDWGMFIGERNIARTISRMRQYLLNAGIVR